MIKIEQVQNGYVVTREDGRVRIEATTESLFGYLLQVFEGRADSFHDEYYGRVVIEWEEPKGGRE